MPVKDGIREIVEWARYNEITVSAMYDIRDYHVRFCRCDELLDTTIAIECVAEAMDLEMHCITTAAWTSELEKVVIDTAIDFYNEWYN